MAERKGAKHGEIAAQVAALADEIDVPRGETGPQKSARLRRLRRKIEDRQLVASFAHLVNEGITTDAARAQLRIGAVRAQRIRSLAVEFGMLRPRQRSAGEQERTQSHALKPSTERDAEPAPGAVHTMRARDASRRFADVVSRVQYAGQRVALTRRGRIVAWLVSVTDMERLQREN